MVFVTGGTGLLGAHLLFDLVSEGQKVRALKRKNSEISIVKKIFHYYSKNNLLFENIEWVEGDVLDILSLEKAIEGIKTVYHCAAIVSFNSKDYKQMQQVNVIGTANLVNVCLHTSVEKICHVSSTAAMGKYLGKKYVTEETEWDKKDTSFYSTTKYWSEQEVWRGKEEGLKIIIVNPCIIIGPGHWGKSSTNIFVEAWKGLTFYTTGSNAFVDVRDVSRCMLNLMKTGRENERYLIISENLSFKSLFFQIADALGKKRPFIKANHFLSALAWRVNYLATVFLKSKSVITKETAQSAQKTVLFSNQKIKKELAFEFIPISQSIKDTATLFLQSFP